MNRNGQKKKRNRQKVPIEMGKLKLYEDFLRLINIQKELNPWIYIL
jgi:hypothetical protein